MQDHQRRAIEKTELASRCLDAAALDVRTLGSQGGALGAAAVDALQGQAQQAEQLAAEIARIGD